MKNRDTLRRGRNGGEGGDVTKEFIGNVQRIGNNRTTCAFEDNLSEQSIETQWRARSTDGTRTWKTAGRGGGLHSQVVLGTGKWEG